MFCELVEVPVVRNRSHRGHVHADFFFEKPLVFVAANIQSSSPTNNNSTKSQNLQ